MAPEQITAEILRKLYRLKILDYDTLEKLVDKLQIRLSKRELRRRRK